MLLAVLATFVCTSRSAAEAAYGKKCHDRVSVNRLGLSQPGGFVIQDTTDAGQHIAGQRLIRLLVSQGCYDDRWWRGGTGGGRWIEDACVVQSAFQCAGFVGEGNVLAPVAGQERIIVLAQQDGQHAFPLG